MIILFFRIPLCSYKQQYSADNRVQIILHRHWHRTFRTQVFDSRAAVRAIESEFSVLRLYSAFSESLTCAWAAFTTICRAACHVKRGSCYIEHFHKRFIINLCLLIATKMLRTNKKIIILLPKTDLINSWLGINDWLICT